MNLLKDIIQQLNCRIFTYVGCTYRDILPEWVVYLVMVSPVIALYLWFEYKKYTKEQLAKTVK